MKRLLIVSAIITSMVYGYSADYGSKCGKALTGLGEYIELGRVKHNNGMDTSYELGIAREFAVKVVTYCSGFEEQEGLKIKKKDMEKIVQNAKDLLKNTNPNKKK